jgi:hypothetical protein
MRPTHQYGRGGMAMQPLPLCRYGRRRSWYDAKRQAKSVHHKTLALACHEAAWFSYGLLEAARAKAG